MVLSTTTIIEKYQTTDFLIFYLLCARAIILEVGKFCAKGNGGRISWNIWPFHGVGGNVCYITFLF
jgi:hypothetical protein